MIKIEDTWADCYRNVVQAVADSTMENDLQILIVPKYRKLISKTIISQRGNIAKAIYLNKDEEIVFYTVAYYPIRDLPKIGKIYYCDFWIDWKKKLVI